MKAEKLIQRQDKTRKKVGKQMMLISTKKELETESSSSEPDEETQDFKKYYGSDLKADLALI